MIRGKGFRIAALVLLVVAYLGIYNMVAMLREPAMALPTPEERVPFRVDFTLPDVQGHLVRLAWSASVDQYLGNLVLSVPERNAVHERALQRLWR